MSKKKKEFCFEQPLTKEQLAIYNKDCEFMPKNIWQVFLNIVKEADSDILNSREMEIALASHISLDKSYDLELDKFFIENYPDILKNAMKLAFKYYLKPEKHPHFEELLNLIKEKPEFSDFHRVCCSLKERYDSKSRAVDESYEKIKEVDFEKAVVAVNILYIREFLPYFDDIQLGNDYYKYLQNYFLDAASDYLMKVHKSCKPNRALWEAKKELPISILFPHSKHILTKDEELLDKINKHFQKITIALLNEDIELLNKIDSHIKAIEDYRDFRYSECESFIFDKNFTEEPPYTTNKEDDVLCELKNATLVNYYAMINIKQSLKSYVSSKKSTLTQMRFIVPIHIHFVLRCLF